MIRSSPRRLTPRELGAPAAGVDDWPGRRRDATLVDPELDPAAALPAG